MKRSIIIIFLLSSIFAFSQSSKIEFKIEQGQIVPPTETRSLTLPLTINFTDKFNGRSIKILNIQNQPIALLNAKFGSGDLSKDGESNKFIVIINLDKTINPGDEKINFDDIILRIDDKDFPIGLTAGSTPASSVEPSVSVDYITGYIYYDAMKLADKETSKQTRIAILNAYDVDLDNPKANPYLTEVIEENKAEIQAGGVAGMITNIGNTDVTHFAAGLARFLAERTKEELNQAFFSKMKMQLNAYPELKTVFPKTSEFLNIIETFSYASVIQVLKEAFETDVQNLPQNLYKIKELKPGNCDTNLNKKKLEACQTRMENLNAFFQTQDGRWVGLGMYTVKQVSQASNPADLLESITLSDELKEIKSFSVSNEKYTNYNVASSIELCNYLSQSLLSNKNDQIWINPKEFKALLSTKDAFTIYLGLLLAKEQAGDVSIIFYKDKDDDPMKFGDILISAHEKYDIYKPELISLIKNSYTVFNTANNAANRMIAATEKSVDVDPQTLYNYYRTFTNAVESITHDSLLRTFTGVKDIGEKYDMIAQYLNPSVDIVYHISVQKYTAAIYDASILLDKITPKADFQVMNKSFLKYGTLISSVANAQSSDEVKNAIEASVLPVGSSSIKRNSNWSISVNAYVGGFYGKAYTEAWGDYKYDAMMVPTDSSKVKKNYQTYGLYAPIGVSFSKGSKKGWGMSLSLQIIDLGALVNFYLTEGDETALPSNFTIRLSNIFAPGAQLGLNIPKTPITLMGGFQFVPALYEVDQISSSSSIVASNAVRWHIGLVVDIPMLNVKVWDFKK